MPRRPPRPSHRKTEAAKLSERRLSGSLSTLYDAARAGDVAAGAGIAITDAWTVLQGSMFLRAINALKAARLLTVELQWEFATGPARQLFELLVTAEFVKGQPDPARTATQFARFGFLQQLRGRLEEIEYAQQTGRPVDDDQHAELLRLLEEFDDLREGKDRRRWPRSWSGHATARLADLSPRQPLRRAQYRQLFAAWSEQIHAAPAALISAMYPQVEPEYEPEYSQLLEDDLIHTAEVAAMIVSLYLELWELLPAIPSPEPQERARWGQALIEEARSFDAPAPSRAPSD